MSRVEVYCLGWELFFYLFSFMISGWWNDMLCIKDSTQINGLLLMGN